MNEIKSNYRNKEYKAHDTVRILNPKQAAFYWSKGIEPLDIYNSRDTSTNTPIIVYIFSKSESQDVYAEWCEREH